MKVSLSRFLKASIMQRTLTSLGTCFGLLLFIAMSGPLEGFAQGTGNRQVVRTDDATRASSGKKSATGGFWANTSKWRQRLLPFTVDKESSADEERKSSGVKGDFRKGDLRPKSQRKPAGRPEEIKIPKQINLATPPGTRDLVTMPATSVPPAASRNSSRPERTKSAKITAGNAVGSPVRNSGLASANLTSANSERRNARPTTSPSASREFVPKSAAPKPIATSDIQVGQSSRRNKRLTAASQNAPVHLEKTTASKDLYSFDERTAPKSVSALGKSSSRTTRVDSGEVRVSDRRADVRSVASATQQSVPSVSRSRANQSNSALSTAARQPEPVNAALSRKSTASVADSDLPTKVKRNPSSSSASRRLGPEPATTSAAIQRRSPRVGGLSSKVSQASQGNGQSQKNPPRASRVAKGTQSKAVTKKASQNASAADRPTRVSARLTSQTVGGELGGSLLFSKSPQLSVETLGPSQVVIGKEATFKIRLRNLGDPVAESVLVRINTPLGAQIVAAQPSRGQTNAVAAAKQKPLEWRVDRLDSHGTEFLTLRIVPRKSDSFDLGVTWTLAPIASQARIKVQEPKLGIEINGPHEIDYGDTKIYRLTITNPGNGVAENVQLKLKPLDGSSRPMAVRNLGSLEPGGKQVMEVELTARQIGYLNVEALAMADTELKTAARQRVLVRRAQLVIEAKGPEMNYAGTTAIYRFQVDNQGNSSAKNIRVIATLPTGGDYLDSSDEGEWNPESRQVVWEVPALVSQNNQTFEVRASLSHPGDNLFQVRLSADDDLAASSEVTTLVEALADLQLVINDPRGPVPVEEETTYEVLISNRGTKAAEMVDVVVFFSEGIEPISVAGGSAKVDTGQVIFHPIEQIAPGEDVVYKIAARANRSGNHVFRTEVACEEADVRLVAEESTRFYGSSAVSAVKAPARKETAPVSKEEAETSETARVPADDLPEYRRKKS